ncbi:lantibiotic dehydratase [Micromonospora sp. CA-263727]|uniref:lantibiotic dehydratase n=1 Tax=Micromonospora sp. CA-263727 TaxID=3239967 RepID=UPI003D8BFCA9
MGATNPEIRLGGRWRLWDQFALRAPGFPADGVLRLAAGELTLAADRLDTRLPPATAQWRAFEEAYQAAAVKAFLTLQEVAVSPEYQMAVAWQNPALLGRAVRPFLNWTSTANRTSQVRQRADLVAHYWQRFTVKNDTIGFFGPVGWGRCDPAVTGALVTAGTGLVEESTVYFASWALDALARRLGAEPDLRPWVAPQRVPFVRVDGDTAALPGRPAVTLDPRLARVLALCDGTRPAVEIGRQVGDDAGDAIDELVRRRLVVWRLDLPADAYPERHLRAWLDRVGDPVARQRGLDQLDRLERGRARVRAASGPDELLTALSALEGDFTELADASARDKSDTTTPGRRLAYSDSRRSASVRLGDEVVAALAPLDLMLTSATWLTSAVADRVRERVRRVYDSTGPVDLASFWFTCMSILHSDAVADAAELQREYWARWDSVLHLPEDARRVHRSLSEVSGPLHEAFPAEGGGWPTARYLSPDVMIAADDVEAIGRGEFEIVLGELHVAINTLGASLYLNQHPCPEELFALTDRDHPLPRLMPATAKENRARLSTRIRYSLVRPEDQVVALTELTTRPGRPGSSNSADVQVRSRGDQLVAVLPDGAEFDLFDVFAHVLTTLVMDRWRILPERDHTPRVTVDRLVLARETWRFDAGDLAFAAEKNEARRFVRTRGFRAAHGLPRFVFVTSPAEPRPLFVDFDSPVYVNLFTKAARRLATHDAEARMTVAEMLPTPEQTWLVDDRGNRYTSELRLVAFDTAAR